MSIDAHGTRFEYLETPGTRPIVLVHGVGLDQSIWGAMLVDFVGRSTLTYDLLGHGDTDKRLGAQTFHPFIGQLRALLEELQIEEMVLVGVPLWARWPSVLPRPTQTSFRRWS